MDPTNGIEITCGSFHVKGIKHFLMIGLLTVEGNREIVVFEKQANGSISSWGVAIEAADWKFLQSAKFKHGLRRTIDLLHDEDKIKKINTRYLVKKEINTTDEVFELMLYKPNTREVSNDTDNPKYLQGFRFIISDCLHFLVCLDTNSVNERRFYYELRERDPTKNEYPLNFNWKPSAWKFAEIMENKKFVIEKWLFDGEVVCEQLNDLSVY